MEKTAPIFQVRVAGMDSNLAHHLYVHGSCGYAEAGGTSANCSLCSGAADSSPAFLDLHRTVPDLTPMGKSGAHTGHTAGTLGSFPAPLVTG